MPAKVLARVVALGVLGISCLLGSGTAWAGGPTSALLVSPANQTAFAVYYADPEYNQLMTLLEPAPGASTAQPSAAGSNYVTVTWLIHDVSVWRIDRIFLPAAGEPQIVTQLLDGTDASADGMYPGQSGGAAAATHRSADPVALQDLLRTMGLLGPPAGPANADGVATGLTVAEPAAAADPADAPAMPAVAPWWWAIGGLLLGIGVAALGVRFVPAVRRRFGVDRPDADDEPVRMVQLPV